MRSCRGFAQITNVTELAHDGVIEFVPSPLDRDPNAQTAGTVYIEEGGLMAFRPDGNPNVVFIVQPDRSNVLIISTSEGTIRNDSPTTICADIFVDGGDPAAAIVYTRLPSKFHGLLDWIGREGGMFSPLPGTDTH